MAVRTRERAGAAAPEVHLLAGAAAAGAAPRSAARVERALAASAGYGTDRLTPVSLSIFVPKLKPVRWSLTEGRGQLLSPEGDVLWEDPDWIPNALMDEGEESVLNVYFRAQSNPSKFICLLTAAPVETDTMAVLATAEVFNPPLNGYAREEIVSGDWGAPALDAGDMQTTALEQTLGPAASNPWNSLTHVGLVTASTGQTAGSGKFILFIALSATTNVGIGQSFKYTMRAKGQ